MIKYIRIFLLIMLLCGIVQTAYAASEIPQSISYLINNAKNFNGKEVVIRGEVVGTVMRRLNFGWINVYDGQIAIGFWCNEKMLTQIKYAGDYSHRGDIVSVTGILNQHCAQHAGDLDVHAISLVIKKQGTRIERTVLEEKKMAAFIGLGLSVFLGLFVKFRKFT